MTHSVCTVLLLLSIRQQRFHFFMLELFTDGFLMYIKIYTLYIYEDAFCLFAHTFCSKYHTRIFYIVNKSEGGMSQCLQ